MWFFAGDEQAGDRGVFTQAEDARWLGEAVLAEVKGGLAGSAADLINIGDFGQLNFAAEAAVGVEHSEAALRFVAIEGEDVILCDVYVFEQFAIFGEDGFPIGAVGLIGVSTQ